MPSKTVLNSEPDLGGAHSNPVLLLYVFLSPMFTTIGTRTFPFVAVISVFLYIIQFSSVAQSCPTLRDPMNRSTPGLQSITNSRSSLRLTSIESVMPSSHLILCCPLLLPWIPPSIRVFSNESTLCMRGPKYWSFSFSITPSKEIQGWSPSEWTGWISLQSKRLSRVFSNTTVQKHQFFSYLSKLNFN